MPKTFLIDTSRCTACRGCQIACKEWHELPANKTTQYQWGSHQNPQDLNAYNYKLVRFSEHLEDGVIRWNFFPDQCRHCVEPPCKDMADLTIEGAILKDRETGAVLYTEKTAEFSPEEFEEIRQSCPYDIPRRDEATGRITKCTMCYNRLQTGMLPACVKVCPTGTMNFGEREEMLELANQRLEMLQKDWPDARLADPEDVNVIYLLIDEPENYCDTAVAAADIGPMSKKQFLANLTRPFKAMVKA